MHKPRTRAIVRTYTGRGEIVFPRGGRIQSHFKLTEYESGTPLLTCEGVFPPASYQGWEQLVHHYRLGPGLAPHQAQHRGLLESFAGRTGEDQPVSIPRMLLVGAEAWGVGGDNLRLQMQFDCLELRLPQLSAPPEPAPPVRSDP